MSSSSSLSFSQSGSSRASLNTSGNDYSGLEDFQQPGPDLRGAASILGLPEIGQVPPTDVVVARDGSAIYEGVVYPPGTYTFAPSTSSPASLNTSGDNYSGRADFQQPAPDVRRTALILSSREVVPLSGIVVLPKNVHLDIDGSAVYQGVLYPPGTYTFAPSTRYALAVRPRANETAQAANSVFKSSAFSSSSSSSRPVSSPRGSDAFAEDLRRALAISLTDQSPSSSTSSAFSSSSSSFRPVSSPRGPDAFEEDLRRALAISLTDQSPSSSTSSAFSSSSSAANRHSSEEARDQKNKNLEAAIAQSLEDQEPSSSTSSASAIPQPYSFAVHPQLPFVQRWLKWVEEKNSCHFSTFRNKLTGIEVLDSAVETLQKWKKEGLFVNTQLAIMDVWQIHIEVIADVFNTLFKSLDHKYLGDVKLEEIDADLASMEKYLIDLPKIQNIIDAYTSGNLTQRMHDRYHQFTHHDITTLIATMKRKKNPRKEDPKRIAAQQAQTSSGPRKFFPPLV